MFETDKYRSKGRPGVGGTRTRGDKKYSLILLNTLELIILNSRLNLPQELENWFTNIYQSGDESTDVLKSTQETSDLFLNSQCRHVKDGSDLIWICFYASLTDHVSQQFPRSHSKSVLLGIRSQSKLSNNLKKSLQSYQVICFISRFHNHVIYINLNISMHHIMEKGSHCYLVGSSWIL